jgi:hypothetical protein
MQQNLEILDELSFTLTDIQSSFSRPSARSYADVGTYDHLEPRDLLSTLAPSFA